ncbi:MAG: hypothetical protein EPN56_11055 [Rhodanobacter sp.]|nr:MAG: hypothetical protein EPN78_12760 [Rhodanobacter sp.]TAM13131.1 MAG: hypothetical protein EPN66_06245 [Rhodanobacter sp.]TAM35132.1 MAG: hypothetical protein EPN56_11055 [Rhodanobacter sp.]
MKRFHIALIVADLDTAIADYSKRLGQHPQAVVADTYAMWRTELLNFSISQDPARAGQVRNLGFEEDEAEGFRSETDSNGIAWERFSALTQDLEVIRTYGIPVHPAHSEELIRN